MGGVQHCNKYRIVVWINYPYRVVYVRFIGTAASKAHAQLKTIWRLHEDWAYLQSGLQPAPEAAGVE